jgi:ABC-type transporter Mla MlaB component
MLRITIAEMATEQRWTLEGGLVGPWVGELRTCWKKRHRAQNGRTCTLDLRGVTFIDKGGQRLLQTMSKEGTQFIATGMYIKYVLDQLKPNGKRGLLKVLSCLFGALLGAVIVRPCSASDPGPTQHEYGARLDRRTQFSQSAAGNHRQSVCPKLRKEQNRAS